METHIGPVDRKVVRTGIVNRLVDVFHQMVHDRAGTRAGNRDHRHGELFRSGGILLRGGYDPEEWSGFAFGTGLDRFAMFRYAIPDIRYLYQNDIRMLNEFDRKDEE